MNENIRLAQKKATQSSSKYKISAMAFNKKGEVMARAINKMSKHNHVYKGIHAEIELLGKCKSIPKEILLCRVNPNGNLMPIEPCKTCGEILRRLKIKVKTVTPVGKIKSL